MKFFTLSIFLFTSLLMMGQDKVELLSFEPSHIELGKVKKGDKKEMVFQYTNTSAEEVEISLVSSCECTTTEYPRGVIKPGDTGILDVLFDSTEKEESETVDVDIILKNTNAAGNPVMIFLTYSFELIE